MGKSILFSSMKSSIGSLAALAALSSPVALDALIVNSALSDITLPAASTSYIDLDIDGDGTNDFFLNGDADRIEALGSNGLITDGGLVLVALNEGYPINSLSTYEWMGAFTNFVNAGTHYVGVEFDRSGSTHYGWLEFNFTGINFTDGTLVSAAWENSADTTITAGAAAVPEPAETTVALGLLAGIATFFRRRFRRAE